MQSDTFWRPERERPTTKKLALSRFISWERHDNKLVVPCAQHDKLRRNKWWPVLRSRRHIAVKRSIRDTPDNGSEQWKCRVPSSDIQYDESIGGMVQSSNHTMLRRHYPPRQSSSSIDHCRAQVMMSPEDSNCSCSCCGCVMRVISWYSEWSWSS